MKIFYVKSGNGVREWLDHHKIDYSYDEIGHIYANLSHIPEELKNMTEVIDPVFEEDGKWYSRDPGENCVSNACKDENEARIGFKCYISWHGIFVKNSI